MFKLLLLSICAFIFSWAGTPPGSIFQNGFEVAQMYISTDRPANIVWAVDSTNHNATILTSLSFLTDGLIKPPTRFTWDIGTPVNTDFVSFTPVITSGVLSGDLVVAVFMPNTPYAVPAGVIIGAECTFGMVVVEAGANVVALNNGGNAMITILPGTAGLTFDSIVIKIYNSIGSNIFTGTPWATSGQTVDVGEIWFGTAHEFKNAADPEWDIKGGPTARLSHNNTDQPLFLYEYDEWKFSMSPMTDTRAFNSASAPSFDSVRRQLLAARSSLILPRIYTNGTSTLDPVAENQLAIFGRVQSMQPLKGVKDGRYWTAGMVFAATPP